MHKCRWGIAAGLGVAISILAAPAGASPVIGADTAGMKAAAEAASPVEEARWVSRCWRDRRGRHCRRVWVSDYYYGPGLGLYFGGPRRHFRGYRGHRPPQFRGYGGPQFRGGPGPRRGMDGRGRGR